MALTIYNQKGWSVLGNLTPKSNRSQKSSIQPKQTIKFE